MLRKAISLLGIALLFSAAANAQQKTVDILIKNAYVFNGDGGDSVLTNVGITGERIAYIGTDLVNSKEVIDAQGKFLAPGFIDAHTHADRWVKDRKRQEMLPWLYQGVTTVFAGNDGFGPYKIGENAKEFKEIGMGTNFAFFVGFGPVRQALLANNDTAPTAAQLGQMKKMVADGMQEGAIGFSTGLIYLPQMYSKTDEVTALYAEAAKYGAVYDTHMRNEGDRVEQSIDETLAIGQNTNLPLHISHIKVSGEANWGKADKVIAQINAARAKGVNITANQYPFIASMTSLKATLMPGWAQEGGSKKTLERFKREEDLARIKAALEKKSDQVYQRIIIMSKSKKLAAIAGKSVYDIAKAWNKSNADAAIDIFKMDIGVSCVNFSMNEDDVVKLMQQPWVMTGSDGGGLHPRTYATFTRIIEEYVQKRKLMSMAWAIHRATGLTATTFNLKERGFIREGYYADIIIFDPLKVKANSTFAQPEQYSQGMDYVFVNGVKAVDNGKKTGSLAGQVLKRL
jgi:N-acyl-D-aspartate/D-glutamate deacylase